MSDDLEPLVEALKRRIFHLEDRVDDLEETVESQRADLADMSDVVDPDPGSAAYEQLTKVQKVHRVRKKLVTTAANTNGRAKMEYSDVQTVFDGHPSAAHCYDLMERAAQMDGFGYDTPPGSTGNKRIRVDIGDVNDEAMIHAAKKARGEEAA